MDLKMYGWCKHFETEWCKFKETGWSCGRIFLEHQHLYHLHTADGELLAEVSGKFRYQAEADGDYPAVGDWVAAEIRKAEGKATIQAILARQTRFSRKTAGNETREQVVAANFDTVFIMSSLNQDFNPRRIERYLIMAWESGANPVIVLSKADLCSDTALKLSLVATAAPGVPVHVVSSLQHQGLAYLKDYLAEGKTVAILGSSGVGKSTLINVLAGREILKVREIREDDAKGRHTTTHRQLVLLPEGGMIIDTPGMREMQLWNGSEGFHESRSWPKTAGSRTAAICRSRDARCGGRWMKGNWRRSAWTVSLNWRKNCVT